MRSFRNKQIGTLASRQKRVFENQELANQGTPTPHKRERERERVQVWDDRREKERSVNLIQRERPCVYVCVVSLQNC